MTLPRSSRPRRKITSFLPPGRLHVRVGRGVFFWAACLGLVLISLNIISGIIDSPLAYAIPVPSHIVLKGAPSHPNKTSPTAGAQSLTRSPQLPSSGTAQSGTPQIISHNMHMPMKAGSVTLQVGKAVSFVGSDGRLELDIPAGAVTAQDLAAAGGTISLRVTQVAPASGSNASGSGEFSLGAYLLQLVDSSGHLLSHGLRKPLVARYHLQKGEQSLYPDHAYVLLNGTLSQGAATLPGVVQPATNTSLVSTMGSRQVQKVKLDTTSKTLSVSPLLSTPSTSLSWNDDSPVATFGKPDPASVNLSSGSLSYQEQIEVPAGPGDLTPPVNLTYSSEAVNEQHNPSAAASWVGEGWNLSMGEISWAESNVLAGCSNGCSPEWESVWYLNDAYGASSQLIPPNINVSSYYDDSPNYYCATGNSAAYPCPILWHTATESHDKIYMYVGPVNIGQPQNPPCWRVWLPNGIMEEFGCTADSLQYYYEAGLGALVTGWYLDMITDPQGNQIHFTYQRDMENWTSPVTGTTYSYPRDVQLASIQYDSPGCHNAQTMCTGSSWAPQMQIVFNASHNPGWLTGSAPTGCNTGANLRCDDPLDLSGNGGIATSLIQNTFVLNSVQVQVRSSGSASWNTLRTYELGYEQSGPSTITDPSSGLQRSVAGMLDLTRFQEVGAGGATELMYSGRAESSSSTDYAYMKVFDLSGQNITIGSNTTLSYWIYPQSSTESAVVSGNNSTCVAVDMIFTDGTDLRDSGAVDQNGNQLHPAHQCGHLTLNQWNYVTSDIGAKVSGKTISHLDVGYDQLDSTGGYRGYIDDITLSNPNSATPLFAANFESGSPQPTWTSTVDTPSNNSAGGISNVGGICCGLTGPEMVTRQERAHTDSAAQPMVSFAYTGETNTYVDSFFHPNPSTNCGPSWNTGNGSGCLLWSQNYASNSRFLSSVNNGQGLSESFSWKIAHNNSHGVPGGGSANANPFACDSSQSGYPCNEADDSGWSHAILTQQQDTTLRLTQNGQGGQQTSTPITETTNYSYLLTYPLTAQECSDCVAGMYWGNQNDNDYLGFYNGVFMGFAQATVDLPTGGVEVHSYYAGEGWGVYDTGQAPCFTKAACHNDPWWALANAAHGREYEVQSYDADGTTLLRQVNTTYSATCPPSGVSGTPASSTWGNWDGKLVSELDHNNPVAACDIQQTQQVSKTYDGASNPVTTTTSWSYDSYGRVTQETTTSNGGTPSTVVHNTSYVWNDSVSANQTSASGTYLLDTKAFTDAEDGSGNRLSCNYANYDGQSYTTGQTSTLTSGLVTSQTSYANCGTAANGYTTSGPSTTITKYDTYGDVVGTTDPDANAGISGHTGCSVSSVQYTTCTTYDGTFDVFPTASSNALNQTSSTSYGNTGALFGFGTWPQSTTDVNNQTTSYTYDALGRMTGETLPGETSGDLTKQWVYTNWCSGTAAQIPCEEIDEIDRLNSSTTVTTRAFYDGEGRLVETRAPGPVGQDVVIYAYYDSAGRQIFKSNPYFVTAYTGSPGAAAYSIPDSTQPGKSTSYSNLRTTSVTDPNSFTTTTTDSVICGVVGTSDTGCYVQSMVVDANDHESATLTGGQGKTNYTQAYTGTNGSYALYATTTYTYDAAGNLLSTVSPDGSTTTAVYNGLGKVTSQSDPDRGVTTATYDPNGNLIQSVDARGSTGTVFTGYDGLNRPLWQNSTNSPTGAWVTYSYDSTANGNDGVGQLTGESFTGSGGLSGAYAYTYDGRGQQIAETVTVNGTNYPVKATYNDNGQVTSQTYPTGEVVTPGYDANGWLTGLSTQSGSAVTTLASNLAYSGLAGAAGKITTMDYGSGDIYTASYDTGLRLTSASLTEASNNAVLYSTQPVYDAVNNVIGVQTSISGSTDTQQFCYDSLNRLTWASSTGTPPCAGLTPGTLTAAQYQQSDSYNKVNGLVSGPAGSYTYGDSSHPHAVTSTSSGYSATYDAAGNLICRALTSATTCNGSSPTGQQLSYDPSGRLSSWQNQPSSPTSTANYLYDGSGNRVAMLTTVNGTTTLTAYIGSIEEVQTTGSTTTTTTYYAVDGMRIAANINGAFDYFGYDGLGSQVVVLNNSGALIGSQLYGPYGNPRYSSGTLPTSIGFTGQHTDSVTGLDYYNARYYDPVVGQFLSADVKQGNAQGTSPYAYVGGNPETRTDPTGQRILGPNGEMAWINPFNGYIYVETPTSPPKVVGHVSSRPPVSTPHSPRPPAPPQPKKPKPSCNFVCGPVKDGGRLAGGIKDAVIGGGITAAAIAGLFNNSWLAGLGTGFLLSWLGQGLSDILAGAREIFTAFSQVSAGLLFGLDIAKLLVDVATAIISAANIINIIRSPGPGLGFLGKLGYVGKSVVSLFTGAAAPTATLMAKTATLISSAYQLVGAQGGVISDIASDWSNVQSDWGAVSQG